MEDADKQKGTRMVAADESESADPQHKPRWSAVKRPPADVHRQSTTDPDNGGRPSKRCHTGPSSDSEDELDSQYVYIPVSLYMCIDERWTLILLRNVAVAGI